MSPPLEPLFVLGCGRLGSTLTPLNDTQSLAFVRQAYDWGVRHFDTASIYGQGDSELLLGRALQSRFDNVCIATKAGQRLTPRQRLMRPFKPLVRSLMRSRTKTQTFSVDQGQTLGTAPLPATADSSPQAAAVVAAKLVAAQRAQGVNYCFEPGFLMASLRASLARLGAARVELFYLHSPSPLGLAQPALWDALDRARRENLFGQLGVSCDEFDTAEAALACEGVEVIQFQPDGSVRSHAILQHAAERGVQVYARLGPHRHGDTVQALRTVLAAPAVTAVVMGTTNAEHLAENLRAFRLATGPHRGLPP